MAEEKINTITDTATLGEAMFINSITGHCYPPGALLGSIAPPDDRCMAEMGDRK
jgi:hypothetical protein